MTHPALVPLLRILYYTPRVNCHFIHPSNTSHFMKIRSGLALGKMFRAWQSHAKYTFTVKYTYLPGPDMQQKYESILL